MVKIESTTRNLFFHQGACAPGKVNVASPLTMLFPFDIDIGLGTQAQGKMTQTRETIGTCLEQMILGKNGQANL